MNKPKYHYRIVHDWLNKHYGKANKCESDHCTHKSNIFEYCLKKGKDHDRDRENYLMLCRSCHRKYDMTEKMKKVLSDRIAGKYNKNLLLGPKSRQRRVLLLSEGKVFESGKELAEYLGADKSSVYMVLSGKRKSLYGHKIEYADS